MLTGHTFSLELGVLTGGLLHETAELLTKIDNCVLTVVKAKLILNCGIVKIDREVGFSTPDPRCDSVT